MTATTNNLSLRSMGTTLPGMSNVVRAAFLLVGVFVVGRRILRTPVTTARAG
jgi:hypothetical protein